MGKSSLGNYVDAQRWREDEEQREVGRREERERIVTWLRFSAEGPHEHVAFPSAADAIENRMHLKQKPAQ